MVTACCGVSVAERPAPSLLGRRRTHCLSEPIGGSAGAGRVVGGHPDVEVGAGAAEGDLDRRDRLRPAQVEHQADAALDAAELRVAEVGDRPPAGRRVAVVGEADLVGVLALVVGALGVEVAGGPDRQQRPRSGWPWADGPGSRTGRARAAAPSWSLSTSPATRPTPDSRTTRPTSRAIQRRGWRGGRRGAVGGRPGTGVRMTVVVAEAGPREPSARRRARSWSRAAGRRRRPRPG